MSVVVAEVIWDLVDVVVVVVVVAVVVLVVVVVIVIATVSGSGGKISGQMILKLVQSFAPTTDAGVSLNELMPFGKSDLKKQFPELAFQLNNSQFGVDWQFS